MNATPLPGPDGSLFLQELGSCSEPHEAADFWALHRDTLHGCRMILSTRGQPHLGLPTRRDFGEGGVLRSLFSHDRLTFLDDNSLADMDAARMAPIPVSHTVMFDLNAVNYVAALLEGKTAAALKPITRALEYLIRNGINYDASLYFLENTDDPMSDAKKDKMFQSMVAWKTLTNIDEPRFLSTGEIISTMSMAEIRTTAAKILDSYFIFRNSRFTAMAFDLHNPVYAILLKTAIIWLSMGGRPSAKRVEALLAFMHEEMSCLFLRELVLGSHFLVNGPGKCPFFNRIQRNNRVLLAALRNMAWDMAAMRRMERFPDDLPREGKRFFVTYLLTFDRPLAELFDIYPLRSIVYKEGMDGPVGFPLFDAADFLRRQCGLSDQILSRYLGPSATQTRKTTLVAARESTGDLISTLEKHLTDLLV